MKPTLTPQRILIRAPSWVGDLVMATANFADLRRAYPDAHITVLLKPGRDKILEGSPDLDEIVFDRAGNSLRAMWALARELRRQLRERPVRPIGEPRECIGFSGITGAIAAAPAGTNFLCFARCSGLGACKSEQNAAARAA